MMSTSPPDTDPSVERAGTTRMSADNSTVLESTALLQGQREILIRHMGSVYRLQATRQGKLILTK
jgi:hemin uptake protein HemP